MAEKLLQRHIGSSEVTSSRSGVDPLSDRELDVFQLIGQGVRTSEIAARLHVSVRTVETYGTASR